MLLSFFACMHALTVYLFSLSSKRGEEWGRRGKKKDNHTFLVPWKRCSTRDDLSIRRRHKGT